VITVEDLLQFVDVISEAINPVSNQNHIFISDYPLVRGNIKEIRSPAQCICCHVLKAVS
jgi:hypothetical protein